MTYDHSHHSFKFLKQEFQKKTLCLGLSTRDARGKGRIMSCLLEYLSFSLDWKALEPLNTQVNPLHIKQASSSQLKKPKDK